MKYAAECEGTTREVEIIENSGHRYLLSRGERLPLELEPGTGAIRRARVGHRSVAFGFASSGDEAHVVIDGVDYVVRVSDARIRSLASAGAPVEPKRKSLELRAPIPGRVVRVLVRPGDAVDRRQHVMTLDAMKLENEIFAPQAGSVSAVLVEPGQAVEKDQVLVRFE